MNWELYVFITVIKRAFKKYNELISSKTSNKLKYATMLRIIEATHGDASSLSKQNIEKYINLLSEVDNIYALYAEYWALHIESEHGFFYLKKNLDLLDRLKKIEDFEHVKDIHIEIIKRCYTDIIRSFHILKKIPPDNLISDFLSFLSENYDATSLKYYKDLYVEANTTHYITLLNNILDNKECYTTYCKALNSYDSALINGMENPKSVTACELKSIDLKLFNPDNITNFENYRERILTFLSNAEINKVSVHVAYCETLLAKLYMVKNLQDQEYYSNQDKKTDDLEIKKLLDDAKNIYIQYQNDYGIIRIEFMHNLYLFATLFKPEDSIELIQKMTDILDKHQEYQREMEIINFLKKGDSSIMTVISLLKAYPVIMQ